MADLSNPLTQLTVGQSQSAVTQNNINDALSPAACFGQNDLTTSGLNWGYYGGRFNGLAIAHGVLALPASQATIYIVVDKVTGVLSQSTTITNWNDTTNYQRLHIATTGSSTITDWDDYREFVASGVGGGSGLNEEQVQDVVGALVQAGSGISVNYDDASSPATLTITNTAPTAFTSEQIEDIVGALVVAGSNVTVTYDDASSPPTLSIASTGGGGGGLTQENVEDIVGTLLVAGSNMTVVYDDASSPATVTLASTGGGATSSTVLHDSRIWRTQASQAGTSNDRYGTTFGSTGNGTPALGTYNTATPQQAATRNVWSGSATGTRLGIWDTQFSHQYNTTADTFNWTAKFWFGTDAAIDTRTGVFIGFYDLNAMTAIPSTSLTNMIGMGADGGASGDTNWQIIRRATGAATKVDTGIARAVNQYFRLTIHCLSGTGITVTVEEMTNFTTGWVVVWGPTQYTTVLPTSAATPNMGASVQRCTHTTSNTDSLTFMNYISTQHHPT